MNKFLKYLDYITLVIVFIVYQFTLAPSVVQIDSGELAAVQYTFGIAHPSGYPLYTLLGYLFSNLPLPFTKIYLLNILASIYVSFGVLFLIKSFKLIILNYFITPHENKTKKRKNESAIITHTISNNSIIILANIAGLIVAFSKVFWFQSTSVEVYSLHILLITLLIYQILRILYMSKVETKQWLISAILLGLGFSNHLTTFLILPALAYVYFTKEGFNKSAFIKISLMLSIFVPILVIFYSLLFFAAKSNALINWGNPVTFEAFWRHFTGHQYQVWMFSSMDAAKQQLGYFFSILPNQFSYLGIIIGLFGMILGFKKSKKTSIFLIINFIFTIIYGINYNINDIDSYFLLAFITFTGFILFGLIEIIKKIKSESLLYNSSLILLPIIQFVLNFSEVNQSGNYSYEDYTKTVLNSVEKNGIILSYQWDYFISESYYFQFVENFRPDVKIIDKELLRRSWYYNQMNLNYPETFSKMKNEINGFLEALKPFERDENFDPQKLEFFYRAIMSKIITDNIDKYAIYLGPEMVENEIQRGEFSLPKGYNLVPCGLLFKITRDTNYCHQNIKDINIRFFKNEDKYINNMKNIVYSMMTSRAIYENNYGNSKKAKEIINNIRKIMPDKPITQQLLNI